MNQKQEVMSCKDYERDMVLYSELSSSDKKSLHAHLQSCSSCQLFFNEVVELQGIISRLSDQKAVPRNAAQLTHRIMDKVHGKNQHQHSLLDLFSKFAESSLLRNVFSILSLVILIVTCVELFSTSWKSENKSVAVNKGTIILNSSAFRQHFLQRKERKTIFSECVSPFKHQPDLICIANKMR
jgi:predicted anti-sigma-YlaC factor YlaD